MIIAFIIFNLSVVSFFVAPEYYSHNFCTWILVMYVISSIWFIRRSLFGNYLNFHLLFFISFFFVNFVYPVFLYPMDPFYFYIFKYEFNHDLISKATALALLGSSSYILGAIFTQSKKVKHLRNSSKCEWISTINRILIPFSYLMFFLFLLFVGRSSLYGIFNSYESSAVYLLILFQTTFILAMILSFLAKQNLFKGTFTSFLRQYSKTMLFFIFFIVTFFFYVGDRGPALQILITFGALYSMYVKAINLKAFVVALLIGMFVLTFISYARTTDPSIVEGGNSLIDYLERGRNRLKLDSFLDLGMNLIVNNRNLYVAVDLADNDGIYFGKTMLPQVISVIPGAGALSLALFNMELDKMSSGKLITDLAKEIGATCGMGNDIIGDIYLSWGVVGVIILMFIFGYSNMKLQIYAVKTNNLFYVVTYMISISYAVYYPRSSYFIAFRSILWSILILMLLKAIFSKRAYQKQVSLISRAEPEACKC